MSIETEVTRLVEAKQSLATWLTDRNVSVPEGALLGTLVELLDEVKIVSGDIAVETGTRRVTADGELLVSDTMTDSNTVKKSFICCLAYSNKSKQLIALESTYGQYFTSDQTIASDRFKNLHRVDNTGLYWSLDSNFYVLKSNDKMTVITIRNV